ncbi:hypothetical protein C0Q70_09000 [Pomacea canaliculata]|uniref:E3 ubiquitin-protein ligase n=1 Tax=Pomacea canaliculata TaxID=400727 RepID=A0A2T7P8K0_POMCA|nr:hypothetical protein C0Q70_09000 [Pomacea canaliculata]
MAHDVPTHSALIKRESRNAVVAYVKEECLNNPNPKYLNDMLDVYLDPTKAIDDYDSITWCKWLIAGGPNYDLFAKKVREYDSSVICGLVWTAKFVAYRCRTCAISSCMSLCADCFHAGNHEGHDYNMFRSQAGGACDCGDVNVMNPSGFCPRHGPEKQQAAASPPPELLAVAQAMMPRIFMRLIFYLRDISEPTLADADQYLLFLHSLSDMGAAMRHIMTQALTDPAQYKALMKNDNNPGYYEQSLLKYETALQNLPYPEECRVDTDGKLKRRGSCSSDLGHQLVDSHSSMLEELVFWMIKWEFPQSIVTLLLGLLPDDTYKNAFTEAFVQHYSRISTILASVSDRSTVANRVVHISVQLFSNESLALRMSANNDLLSTVILSLANMLQSILVPSTLAGGAVNKHLVVECEKDVMKVHCYWPIVSDLINLLTHSSVAKRFLSDHGLPVIWMDLVTVLQGMNVNQRELSYHVEYEPDTYYAAFSAELEICACPMWSLINHCSTPDTKKHVKLMLQVSISALEAWFKSIDFGHCGKPNPNQLTFHLPLHRYLAAFLMLGVQKHGFQLSSRLPSQSSLQAILMHPLQIQVCIPQIYSGMWVRNGIQIKGQAMTYKQCHFCYSMADLDIYLVQVCAASMEPDLFVELLLERFQLQNWLLFENDLKDNKPDEAMEMTPEVVMLDGALGFLCSLFGIRTYLGMTEEEQVRLEMASLLCMNDRQHSQLSELMPDRSGMSSNGTDFFEPVLKQLADYKAPSFEAGVGLNQGTYTPKGLVWEHEFDPVHVSHRAIYRKDFQAAMDRYSEYMHTSGLYKGKNALWPPYKVPGKSNPAYKNLFQVLNCSTMHAFLYMILYKMLHQTPTMPESILYKAVHLLYLCLHFAPKTVPSMAPNMGSVVKDGHLRGWFSGPDIKANACEIIHKVELAADVCDSSYINLASSTVEEVFNLSPTISPALGGPITPAQTGLIPSICTFSSNLSYSVSSTAQPVTATPDMVKPKYISSGLTATCTDRRPEKVLDESIISLVIKLHNRMTSTSSFYQPATSQASQTTSIGDGAFYMARLLDYFHSSFGPAAQHIQSTCETFSNQMCTDKRNKSRDESKRKKAFYRQQKLMAEFASQQKAFMEKVQDGIADIEVDEDTVDGQNVDANAGACSGKKYDCVICNQSTPSRSGQYVGLVVFLQSTSVLGHRQRVDVVRSITEAPSQKDLEVLRCGSILRQRITQMLLHFEGDSVDMSVNIGWDGGVFVTTCGHHLHLDCQRSYVDALRNQAEAGSHAEAMPINRDEFFCPMCRQLSNAVLPMVPDDNCFPLVPMVAQDPSVMVAHLAEMIYQTPERTGLSEILMAIQNTIDAINNVSYKHFRSVLEQDNNGPNFLYISSLVRTNLEMEILLRGGTLEKTLPSTISKRMCLVPLLHVLGLHTKVKLGAPSSLIELWSHITGVSLTRDSSSLSLYKHQVPLLMKDMAADLVHIVLMLPMTMELRHYLFVVQKLYCATYIQALVTVTCCFTQEEREAWRKKGQEVMIYREWYFDILTVNFVDDKAFTKKALNICMQICQSVWSPHSVEARVQEFCLPFLRVAAVLRQHIFGPELPPVQEMLEFEHLVRYLDLVAPEAHSRMGTEVTGSSCLVWAVPQSTVLVQAWCQHINNFAKIKVAECKFFLSMSGKWARPHLLKLPQHYYEIFTSYRYQCCQHCHRIPKDPAICLVCGAFLCFREDCCAINGVSECVEHSIVCGAGTGIFLLINSSIIVVIRGPRATLWGSLYLDQHGEEDRDLKRGKPLYLSRERLEVLESQWLGHTFEHTCKRWIQHKNRL